MDEGDECGWKKWVWMKEMRRMWTKEMCVDEDN